MPGYCKLIVLDRQRLVYTVLPKCASSTMHRLMLDLAGVETSLEERDAVWRGDIDDQLRTAGLRAEVVHEDALPGFLAAHRGYFFFTIVRNPYDRLFSAYNNQLDRYARTFARGTWRYVRAMRSLRSLAGAERQTGWRLDELRRRIPFEQVVRDLAVHGTAFDRHFHLQSQIVKIDQIPYDLIGRVEDLSGAIESVRAHVGGTSHGLALPHLNRSDSLTPRDKAVTPDVRALVDRIYEEDFRRLGYRQA